MDIMSVNSFALDLGVLTWRDGAPSLMVLSLETY